MIQSKEIRNILHCLLYLSLLFVAIGAGGCDVVRDDLSVCRSNTITFSYTADDAPTEHLLGYIDRITVLVYGEDGKLVLRQELDKAYLAKQQTIELHLPTGKYRVVAIGNNYDNTETTNVDAYNTAVLSRPETVETDRPAAATYDRLYLGEKEVTVKSTLHPINDILTLTSRHIKVRAFVLPYDSDGDKEWCEMQKEKGGFRLTFGPVDARTSLSGVQSGKTSFDLPFGINKEGENFELAFNTLRFGKTEPIVVRLMRGNDIMLETRLDEFIAKHKLNIVDKQEAVLTLYFRQRAIATEVRLSPWKQRDVEPIIDND